MCAVTMDSLLNEIWRQAPPDRWVAFGRGGVRRVEELRIDVRRVMAALQEGPAADAPLLFVFREDRYAFAVALLAAWSLGLRVALPPNTRRDTIGELQASGEVGRLVHDLDAPTGVRVLEHLVEPADVRADADISVTLESAWRAIPTNDTAAILYSSGTTGPRPTAIPKTSGQLLAEARSLAGGVVPAGARVVPTVGPSHIYGLLYSVLVPLLTGGSFLRETPFFPESVAAACRAWDAEVLVTVPAHLRSFLALDADALSTLTTVTSSTAPLAPETSQAFYARFGRSVTEILGSTETGGVAWRIGTDDARWAPLPSVELRADAEGRLAVRSPLIHPDEPQPYLAADLVRFEGEHFEHLGRVDGVVKIGGRRVSVPEMEAIVLGMAGVRDAALLAQPTETARGTVLSLAVVAPDLRREDLLEALARRYDRSSLPRRIEFVDALPRESNGKLPRAALMGLFGLNAEGVPIVWEAKWSEHVIEDAPDTHTFSVEIPEAYGWYEGHFPGYPVMAAAVQLHELVAPSLTRVFGAGAARRIRRMKFTGRILPGDRVRIELQGTADAVSFAIRNDEALCTSGVVTWEVRA